MSPPPILPAMLEERPLPNWTIVRSMQLLEFEDTKL